jgi:diacylglycerol kinase family enzyme
MYRKKMRKFQSFYYLLFLFVVYSKTSHGWVAVATTRVSQRTSAGALSSLYVTNFPTRQEIYETESDTNDHDLDEGIIPKLETEVEQKQSPETPAPSGIAIILNTNARGVSDELIRTIQAKFLFLPNEARIFVTSTTEQAKKAVDDLQQQPAQIVIPVGGDGTLTTMIQYFHDKSPGRLPLFGYIPLGTGNALGSVIGCKPRHRFRLSKQIEAIQDVLKQLLDIAQALEQKLDVPTEVEVDIVDLPLLQITTAYQENKKDQICCFFAGIGFDSLMLQDYKELQQWSDQSTFWKDKFQSVWGYTVALFTRTLPKCVSNQSHLVKVELTTKKDALWVDHRRGDIVRKIPSPNSQGGKPQETMLYKGQAGIVAAATTPFYGGNLKLFPFARLTENGCQVRVGRIHPLNGVLNIPKIFDGSYRNFEMGCLDFVGTQFSLEIQGDDGYPVQHSGESMGPKTHVDLQVLDEPARFVTLLPPRLVCEL